MEEDQKRNYLVRILKRMGTDLDCYKINDYELESEIFRRIDLTKDYIQRLRSENRALGKTVGSLRQVDFLELIRSDAEKSLRNHLDNRVRPTKGEENEKEIRKESENVCREMVYNGEDRGCTGQEKPLG